MSYFKNKKEEVLDVLNTFDSHRDSDMKLLSTIWGGELMELGEKCIEDYTALDLLDYIHDGKLTTPESITRIRRKLQQENPELRGNVWKERHEKPSRTFILTLFTFFQ